MEAIEGGCNFVLFGRMHCPLLVVTLHLHVCGWLVAGRDSSTAAASSGGGE